MTDYTKMTDLQLEVADAKAREDLAAAFAARRNIMNERERRGLRLVEPAEDGPDDGGFYRDGDAWKRKHDVYGGPHDADEHPHDHGDHFTRRPAPGGGTRAVFERQQRHDDE